MNWDYLVILDHLLKLSNGYLATPTEENLLTSDNLIVTIL